MTRFIVRCWIAQREAARNVEDHYGADKALELALQGTGHPPCVENGTKISSHRGVLLDRRNAIVLTLRSNSIFCNRSAVVVREILEVIRKKAKKSRSPIKETPLSAPGQSLHNELIEVLFGRGMIWMLVAAFLCVPAAMEWARWFWSMPPAPVTYSVFAIIAIILASVMWRRTLSDSHRLKLGRDGEIAVGQLLEQLRGDGFQVFHDLREDGYNIDHVIIGPPGAFVIETKTVSLTNGKNNRVRYDGSSVWINERIPDRDPIQQVRACTDRVGDILKRATGRTIPLRSVVLYPGWWVDPQPRDAEVWVLNPKALPAFLRHESQRITKADIALFSAALETYVRAKALLNEG